MCIFIAPCILHLVPYGRYFVFFLLTDISRISELFFDNQMLQRSIAFEIPMRFFTLTQAHDPPWLWWHFFYLNGNSWISHIWRKSSRHGGSLDGWSCSSVSLVCYFEVGVEENTNKPMTKLRVFNFQSFDGYHHNSLSWASKPSARVGQ